MGSDHSALLCTLLNGTGTCVYSVCCDAVATYSTYIDGEIRDDIARALVNRSVSAYISRS